MRDFERDGAIRMELPTYDAFLENNNTAFKVELPSGRKLDIRLIGVSDRKVWAQQEQFSVTFQGSLDTFMPQGTYRFEHDKLGSFELFIVPIGKDDQGYSYEAVFNYLGNPA